MRKYAFSTLLVAGATLAGVGALRAQEKMTIGISYQNLAFPYVAALQKAAQNACKALGVDCIEADAVNDTNKELSNVETHAVEGHKVPRLRGGEPRRLRRLDRRGEQEGRARSSSSTARRAAATMSPSSDPPRQIPGSSLGSSSRRSTRKLGKDKLRGIYLRGVAGQVTDIARNDGLKNYLNSAGLGDKIEFVEQYADYDRGKGQAVTESMLDQGQELRFHRREQRRHDPRRPAGRRSSSG